MKYPSWVCWDCGSKAAKKDGKIAHLHSISTHHMGRCDVCKKRREVTEPRDFGYPKFEER